MTLDVRDGNDHEITNTQASGRPVTIMGVPGSMNAGQFIQIDVVSATPKELLSCEGRFAEAEPPPNLHCRARAARQASIAFMLPTESAHVMAGQGASLLGMASATTSASIA